MPDPVLVCTIGHGDRAFGAIEALLARHGCQTIIDVRSQPYSRHAPDFTKRELMAAATVAGLGYRWMGDRLGGRPDDPAPTDWDAIAASPGFQGALDEVAELARGGRVVLLCAELSPEHCHRAGLIAPRLELMGFRVAHILADGSLHAHQPGLFPAG
jgi:uncharacterized protein (DUF488 family)